MSNIVWPAQLANQPIAQALERAASEQRLSHALLFVADDVALADEAARALAAGMLGGHLPHPDYAFVEPANKLRQISVEPMRQLREFLQKGSHSGTKVVHISQADRLRTDSANIFLKIFEEPPEGSFIIMTTAQPHAVLPTLISRAMRFRFSGSAAGSNQELEAWQMTLAHALKSPAATPAEATLKRYGLLAQAYTLWQPVDEKPTEAEATLEEEVWEAKLVAKTRARRKQILAALEQTLLEDFKTTPRSTATLKAALAAIERASRLIEFNLNDAAALELALGGVLKVWA